MKWQCSLVPVLLVAGSAAAQKPQLLDGSASSPTTAPLTTPNPPEPWVPTALSPLPQAAKPAVLPASPALGNCFESPPCNTNCSLNPCPCGPCGPYGRVWADAELLLWWPKRMNLPPLVTSSPLGTPRSLAGVIGAPNTTVLFGGDSVDDDMRTGLRIRAGAWLDCCQTLGVDGSYFFLGPNSGSHDLSCLNGTMILARPFFDVNPNTTNPFGPQSMSVVNPNSELICFPGIVNGSINIHTNSQIYGFDGNVIKNLCCGCNYRFDGLVGYRYLNLQDNVDITEGLTALAGNNMALPAGSTILLQDRFDTTNQFNGGQVGVCGEVRSGRWYLAGRNLVALGDTHSDITITGATFATLPNGVSAVHPGGLLTQATNIGNFGSDRFAVVYENQTALGYQLTDNIRAFVAYSFLYWSNVSRAGDQIDLVVNSSQIPPGTLNGAPRPTFQRKDTDFWVQGISFGVEVRY